MVKEIGQNVGHLGIILARGATWYQVAFLDSEWFGQRCMHNHAVVVDPTGRDRDGNRLISCPKTERCTEERCKKRRNMEKKGEAR